MLCIVDYGLGNLGSIANMLKKIGIPCAITSSPEDIRAADRLILPGVGAFDEGMRNLEERGLIPVLDEMVYERRIPVLGICLGMQLMTRGSDEGNRSGLGWIDARVRRFDFSGSNQRLPVPNMGWRDTTAVRVHSLTSDLPEAPRYYFVHSYYVELANPADQLLTAEYGITYTAAFGHGNILGVQFHPEKSHKFGFALLRNFGRNSDILHLGDAPLRSRAAAMQARL